MAVASGSPPIALDIKYQVSPSPGYFKARVTIEPNDANRWACLYLTPLTASGHQVSHCWESVGSTAPRTTWRELKNLPAGRYEAVAAVIRNNDSSTLSTRIRLTVTGFGYEPEPDIP
jgi:hypothetical protein